MIKLKILPLKILFLLEEYEELNISTITKRVSDTPGMYSYIFSIIKEFEKANYIKTKKRGRERFVSLTKKYKNMRTNLSLFEFLNKIEKELKGVYNEK